MRLRVRPIRTQDVNDAAALLASHPEEQRRYGPLLGHLPSAWLKLLQAGSMISAFVEDMDSVAPRLVACGASVFATDEFLQRLKKAPLVWFGPELVCLALAGDPSILSPEAIRQANSGEGMNVMVWAGVERPPRPEDRSAPLLEVSRFFTYQHTGYRLKGDRRSAERSRVRSHAAQYWPVPLACLGSLLP